METSPIHALESKITHLERHIEAQDSEFYQLSRRLEQTNQLLAKLKTQVEALSQGGGGEMPADERPPHY